jgi:hypothetical protein
MSWWWKHVSIKLPKHLGVVDNNSQFGKVYIKPESFAPGIWAGTEGLNILIGDRLFKVEYVNLEQRRIKLNSDTAQFEEGTIIKQYTVEE